MGAASKIGRELRAHLSKVTSDVMLTVTQNLINATPVATEHALSNWVPSVGAPYTQVDGSPDSVSYAAQDAGIARLKSYDAGRDGSVHVRNNVLYLPFLDRGSSPQASAGWVSRAILAGVSGAPGGRRAAVSRVLRNMARAAYLRTF